MLVIDTCGDRAAVGLSRGDVLEHERPLPERHASASILSEVRALLLEAACTLADLDAIGVVTGPGSFTGMRTGLAVAKGLCEAASLPMAAGSRLEVLAHAAQLHDGFAVLNAGRHELYVREVTAAHAREFLSVVDAFSSLAAGRAVVIAEPQLAERLSALSPRLHELTLRDALPLLLDNLRAGGTDVASADANYVRGEADIYRKAQAAC